MSALATTGAALGGGPGAIWGSVVAVVVAIGLWPGARGRVRGCRGASRRASRPRTERATVFAAADALSLLALALRAGLGPVEALEEVAARVGGVVGEQLAVVAAAHRWGEPPEDAWARVDEMWRPAAFAWRAALAVGAAPAGLLDAAAAQLRRAEDDRIAAAVQRAGVTLVLPLGLLFLPGFICTTVIPVVLHLADALLSG